MIIQKIMVKDLNTKDTIIADGIDTIDICLCEECGKFYVYEDQKHNKGEIASYEFCKKCLSYRVLTGINTEEKICYE